MLHYAPCAHVCSCLLQAQAVPELGLDTAANNLVFQCPFAASLFLQEMFSDAHIHIRHRKGAATRQWGRNVKSLYWISARVKATLYLTLGFGNRLH